MTETAATSSRLVVRVAGPIGALLILGSGAAAAEDHADQRAQARDYAAKRQFHAAEQHFSGGHFRRAIAAYRRAYALRPLPGLLFNIAQCYRNLGRCGQAVRYYRRFVADAPRSPLADDVRAIIARCNRRQPAPASAPVRAAPRRTLARPGAGAEPDRRRSTVANAVISRQPQVSTERSAPDRLWFWSGVVLTGALATAGTITGALALQRNRRYKDPTTDQTERPALRASGEDLALATTLLWGTAVASAVATALVYWLHGDRKRPATTAALSLDRQRLVLGVGGRF